jgi:hypothetical protein
MKIVPSTVPVAEAGKRPDVNRPDEGHLHLMLDLQPPVIWNTTDPYTFANVAPGDHLLVIEAVNNDHSSFSPPAIVQRRLTVQATTAQAPAGTQEALPDTGVAEFLQTPRGNLALLITALMFIDVGFIVRRWAMTEHPSASNR